MMENLHFPSPVRCFVWLIIPIIIFGNEELGNLTIDLLSTIVSYAAILAASFLTIMGIGAAIGGGLK